MDRITRPIPRHELLLLSRLARERGCSAKTVLRSLRCAPRLAVMTPMAIVMTKR